MHSRYYMLFFDKHIKIQGLVSDMFKATQYIGKKYAYDMLILCVKIYFTKNDRRLQNPVKHLR